MPQRFSKKPIARWLSTLLALGVLIALTWPFWTNLRHITGQAQRFHLTLDEILHAEVIENLVQTGRYQQWTGAPFAGNLTTGPALLVPAAMIQNLTGLSGAESGRAMTVLYHLLTLLLIGMIAAKRSRSDFVGFVAAGIFEIGWRGFESSDYFAFGVLGEGTASFFLLLSLYLGGFAGKRPLWILAAGISASLAVLSKPYFIFLPLAFLITQERKAWRWAWAGVALPWICWVGWMVASQGWNWTYHFWWNYPRLMRQVNGAGLPADSVLSWSGMLKLWVSHGEALFEFMKPRSLIMAGMGFVLGLVTSWKARKVKVQGLRTFSVFATIHLAWWFALTPGIQSRYFLPFAVAGWYVFILLAVVPVCVRIVELLKKRAWPRPWGWGIAAGMLILGVYFGAQIRQSWLQDQASPANNCAFCRQLLLQDFWLSKVGGEGQPSRPARLYSFSEDLSHDAGYVLTAPYLITAAPEFAPPGQVGSADAWWLVSDRPRAGALEDLNRRGCRPIFTVPGSSVGFWGC